MKKHSKRILKKQSLRLKKAVKNQSLVDSTAADIASVQVQLVGVPNPLSLESEAGNLFGNYYENITINRSSINIICFNSSN